MENLELTKQVKNYDVCINDGIQSLREYIEEVYLPYFYKISRSSTIRGERSRIDIILNSRLTSMRLCDIQLIDIEDFMIDIQKSNPLTLATLNRYRARLSAIFNYAVEDGTISQNVIAKIKIYKEKQRETVLTDEEIKLLLRAVKSSKNLHLYLIVVIALNTGMRRGEILGLNRGNIVGNNIALHDKETKSGYGRTIPINATLKPLLEAHLEGLPKSSYNLFEIEDIKHSFGTSRKKCNLENVRFHDLRRTFATHLKDNGVNIYDIMKLLGHASVTMTQKYLNSSNDILTKSVNMIGFS